MVDSKETVIERIARDYCEILDDDWSQGKKFYLSKATAVYNREIEPLMAEIRYLNEVILNP